MKTTYLLRGLAIGLLVLGIHFVKSKAMAAIGGGGGTGKILPYTVHVVGIGLTSGQAHLNYESDLNAKTRDCQDNGGTGFALDLSTHYGPAEIEMDAWEESGDWTCRK